MKIFYHNCAFLVLCIAIAFGVSSRSALAQPPEPPRDKTSQWRMIPLHYIAPEIVASLLDPIHHSPPGNFLRPEDFLNQYAAAATPETPSGRPMFVTINGKKTRIGWINVQDPPSNLDMLFVDKKQHQLWMLSTQEEFKKAAERASAWDQPYDMVNFSYKIIEMTPEDLSTLQLQSPVSQQIRDIELPNKYQIVDQSSVPKIEDMLKQRKWKYIPGSGGGRFPYLSTGYFSYHKNTSSTPVTVTIKPTDSRNKILYTVDKESHLDLSKSLTPLCGAIMNKDNTITLVFAILTNSVLEPQTTTFTSRPLWTDLLHNKPSLTNVITIKDGQTAAITGLTTTSLAIDDKKTNVVIFLTAQKRNLPGMQ